MSIARIIWIVSLLAAIILSFVTADQFGHGAVILTVLGLVAGWFVDHEHRLGLIVAAIFLAGGSTAWNALPTIGEHLTGILGSLSVVMSAAAVTAILRRMVERLFLGQGTGN